MCQLVNKGDNQATTPWEFIKMFPGVKPVLSAGYETLDIDSCLCQIDIEKTFRQAGIKFERVDGDYVVSRFIIPAALEAAVNRAWDCLKKTGIHMPITYVAFFEELTGEKHVPPEQVKP